MTEMLNVIKKIPQSTSLYEKRKLKEEREVLHGPSTNKTSNGYGNGVVWYKTSLATAATF